MTSRSRGSEGLPRTTRPNVDATSSGAAVGVDQGEDDEGRPTHRTQLQRLNRDRVSAVAKVMIRARKMPNASTTTSVPWARKNPSFPALQGVAEHLVPGDRDGHDA